MAGSALHAEADRVVEILAQERARDAGQSIAVLVQSRVDAKTNEHKGALALLEWILLKDTVVVADAAFSPLGSGPTRA